MKKFLGKKLLIVVCNLLLLLTWASTARADMEIDSFVYTGYIHFPSQIGGLLNYTGDCIASGTTLTLNAGYLGLEVDFMTGIAWDDWNNEWDSTLPFLWSGNFIVYPFSQSFIAPYVKVGFGGIGAWLQLENNYLTGFYYFSRWDIGAGISFGGGSNSNYFFIEYLHSDVWGHGEIAGFHLHIYKAGYVVVY